MTEHTDWRTDLSFSDRFANLAKITSAFQALPVAQDAPDARQEAKSSEEDIRKHATSLNEYHQRCQALIQRLESQSGQRKTGSDTEDVDETAGELAARIDIGRYKGAIYHRNGITSSVYKARAAPSNSVTISQATTAKLVALKVAEPAAMEPPHNIQREVRILTRAASGHIIPLLEALRNEHGRLVLVFPFMRFDLPALLSRGTTFTLDQRRGWLRGLFNALAHLHSLSIIHRDVKPSNILLGSVDGPVYLADFGIAWDPIDPASEPADAKITDVGTTCYRPPELLFGNTSYGTALDLWAAGCVVAEVLDDSIDSLFDAGDVGSDLTLISSIFRSLGTPNLESWPEAEHFPDWGKFEFHRFAAKPWGDLLPKASETGRDLVAQLVRYESIERMSAATILDHPFFKET